MYRPWHYTVGVRAACILEDGTIRAGGKWFLVKAGRRISFAGPVVWFTLRQDWEPTANKVVQSNGRGVRLSTEETEQFGRGLVRFGVDFETASGYHGGDYRRDRWAETMTRLIQQAYSAAEAVQPLDPETRIQDWRFYDKRFVSISEWRAVEVLYKNHWTDIEAVLAAGDHPICELIPGFVWERPRDVE